MFLDIPRKYDDDSSEIPDREKVSVVKRSRHGLSGFSNKNKNKMTKMHRRNKKIYVSSNNSHFRLLQNKNL